MVRNLVSVAVVVSAVTVAADQPAPLSFQSIDVNLPGVTGTNAFGINAEGDIVGRYLIGAASHGYVLSDGVVTTIDEPNGIPNTTAVQGINPEGDVVGTYLDHGTVVGGDPFRTRAYLREENGQVTPIDFPGAENTLAIKISPRGQVVGCYHHQSADTAASQGGTMHGYVYHNGSYESLAVPGTMNNGITRNGRLIVGVWFPTSSEYHAYRVMDGVYSLLDLPSDVMWSDARDVNSAGEIVGYYADSSSAHKIHGFLLNRRGFTTIDVPGASLTRAFGINPQGEIAGSYVDVHGPHGFIATRHHRDDDDATENDER
jgi:uncharacterized membrane protein